MKMYVRMLSLRVHTLMQGQLTAALEGKDWSTSLPSNADGTGWTITSQSESSHSMLCYMCKGMWLRLCGRFMCTTVTLLNANDLETIETDPMDLTLPLIPKSRLSVVQPPSHLAELERVQWTNMQAPGRWGAT